ncbi:AI-2E family transporter [uncultured Methanomethylovorans sp.]|uniref:AI-2E family transporter n=1 Tax=uncultured Methanomethylovorans sp. TaxID=183759 RepID=UPI002AA842D3|nr:AI-2E family transporter [uncultured Methanomethylovorans sp.]
MQLGQLDGISVLISSRLKIAVVLIIILLSLILASIFLPLADGIVLGLVLAYIARPIYLKLHRYQRLGALLATLIIVMPVVLIIGSGIFEITRLMSWIFENQGLFINNLFDFIASVDVPPQYNEPIRQFIWDTSTSILPLLSGFGLLSYAKSILMFILNLVISVLVCYFLLADGYKVYKNIVSFMPVDNRPWVAEYIKHLDLILKGVFIGNAYAALFVSVTSLIVFYLFGFSHILALATLIFIASIVPLFAGYTVLIALAIIRYFQMGLESALLFFIVASIVIYLPPEFILRPYLASMHSRVHPLLIMLSFLGGAFVGGISGFFLAPIILACLISAYRVHMGTPVYGETKKTDTSA